MTHTLAPSTAALLKNRYPAGLLESRTIVLIAPNVAHAVGNVVFFLAFGPALVRVLLRYRARLEVRWTEAAPPLTSPTLQRTP